MQCNYAEERKGKEMIYIFISKLKLSDTFKYILIFGEKMFMNNNAENFP